MEKSLVESVFGISKVWFIRWTLVTIISVVVCYSIRPFVGYESEFGVLVNAMNVFSFVMTFGLPFFLAASISFSTTDARSRILTMIESGKSTREVFLRRLIGAYALILLFSVGITTALFVEPIVLGTTFNVPEGTGYLIYLLPVLISTIIFSFLIVTIGALLAVVTDDIIISSASGSIVTICLAAAVGLSPQALWQSLTRGLAMFSPSNTARIFAGLLSGRDPQQGTPFEGTSFASYFGFEATPLAVLVSLFLLCVIAFVSAISSVRILNRTTPFWKIQSEVSTGIWVSETEQKGLHLKPTREMKIRKIALVGLVIFLLSGVLFWTTSYKNSVLVETTIILYQSPEGGNQISLGEWFVFDIDLQPAQFGLANYLHRETLIDDWGNAPDELTFYYGLTDIQSSEFLLLNETEREATSRSRNVTEGWGGFGGIVLIQEDRFYTYVLKVVATENPTLEGVVYLSINIYQAPYTL